MTRRYRQMKQSGLCPHCGAKAAPGRVLCDLHMALNRRNMTRLVSQRLAANFCMSCGARPPVAGFQKCDGCRRRHSGLVRRATIRARGVVGSHTEYEWQQIKARQGGRCAHCHEISALTRDHIKATSRGGTDYAKNIQGLCGPCNSRKGNRDNNLSGSAAIPLIPDAPVREAYVDPDQLSFLEALLDEEEEQQIA